MDISEMSKEIQNFVAKLLLGGFLVFLGSFAWKLIWALSVTPEQRNQRYGTPQAAPYVILLVAAAGIIYLVVMLLTVIL